jgi:hypothetical protein
MAKQVTQNDIVNIIKEKLKSSGADQSDDIVERIKQSVIGKYNLEKEQQPSVEATENSTDNPVDIDISSEPTQTEQDVVNPESVRKEVETDVKVDELRKKEQELEAREAEIKRKEEALKYKPQLPEPLKEVGKAEFFVFDENQISLGAEALTNAQFYLKGNPEVKSSMHNEWINKGMTKAELFKVKFEKIGELEYDFSEGTTKLISYTEPENIQGEIAKGFPVEVNTVVDEPKQFQDSDVFDEIIREKIEKYLSNQKNNA